MKQMTRWLAPRRGASRSPFRTPTAQVISPLQRWRHGVARLLPLVLAGLTVTSSSLAAVFENRVVGRIETPDLVRDCLFFTLQGVAGTDPSAPSDPWFV